MNMPFDIRNHPRAQVRQPDPAPAKLYAEAVVIGVIVVAGFINAAWHLFG